MSGEKFDPVEPGSGGAGASAARQIEDLREEVNEDAETVEDKRSDRAIIAEDKRVDRAVQIEVERRVAAERIASHTRDIDSHLIQMSGRVDNLAAQIGSLNDTVRQIEHDREKETAVNIALAAQLGHILSRRQVIVGVLALIVALIALGLTQANL